MEISQMVDDKYTIEGAIGVGGMGAVYRASHVKLGRKVAIKVLLAEYAADERTVKRFLQEAEIAGSLGHDNICEVTDIGSLPDGSPYLVMPLLKGNALSELVKDSGCLPVNRAVDIVDQILSALETTHDQGIVHRDLKPDNIFITQVGDRKDFVKLLDFGISKVIRAKSDLELTKTGTVVGSPYFMSPEQAKGDKNVNHLADIYSTGVILYRLVTGRYPFEGNTYTEVIANIFTAPIPLPRTIVPSIPKLLEQTIIKAINRNPTGRFSSANEMRLALANALSSKIPARDNAATLSGNTLNSTSAHAFADKPVSGVLIETSPSSPKRKKRPLLLLGIVSSIIALIVAAVFATKPKPPASVHRNGAFKPQIQSQNRPINSPEVSFSPKMRPASDQQPDAVSPPNSAAPSPKPSKPIDNTSPPTAPSATRSKTDVKKSSDNDKPAKKRLKVIDKKTSPASTNVKKGRSRTHIITDYE